MPDLGIFELQTLINNCEILKMINDEGITNEGLVEFLNATSHGILFMINECRLEVNSKKYNEKLVAWEKVKMEGCGNILSCARSAYIHIN